MTQKTQPPITQWIGNHQMTVLLDSGVSRHLRFSDDGGKKTNHWFDIVTFDEGLLFTSGFGCYSFSKRFVSDMFEFFRGRDSNSTYVAEKITSKSESEEVFSNRIAKEYLLDSFSNWIDEKEIDEDEAKWLLNEFGDEFDEREFLSADDVRRAYCEFDFAGYLIKFDFNDFYPYELSQKYIDCVDAIKWGIKKYDEYKDETPN